ncbi:MAG: argininosuccinate lyase [Acidobacteria bacterium]|nr:argininosuccinate lyase [Acidobacteriota bacterium]
MSRLRDRFDEPVSPAMERFASSLDVDLDMVAEDLTASKAHARMLGEVGVLATDEVEQLLGGLERIGSEFVAGEFVPTTSDEDIHMAVERRLTELVGEVGGKLHTARSRNDQVATDVRLWLKARLARLSEALNGLVSALVARTESDGRILMPGYTHLQRGQPILLGHHLLAHAWAVDRDRQRVAAATSRVDASPLGAGAMAGTPHAIDRRRTAELLGFGGVVENAMDAVAARDHMQEVAAVCAIAVTHLSRMAAELVLWSSAEFAFVRLADAHTTGSSIMPQKRNPDAVELVRGKTGRVYGDLMSLLTLTKGLPMSYNRDLQEDRRPLFDAVTTTIDSVELMIEIWSSLELAAERFTAELAGDPSLATELADALAETGMPFRQAHRAVARLMAELAAAERTLDTLTDAELEGLGLEPHHRALLDPRAAAERRTSLGGTSWSEIERQIALLR